LQAAYQIDPSDPDIQHAWRHTVNPSNDIQRIEDSLATMNNLDPQIWEKAQASANSMMPLLSENSQTYQSAPITTPVTLPLIPAYENVEQISGYKLAVDFPKGKAKLTVDTAASGLYIGRALAETNNFQHAEGAPANTVRVDNLQIGHPSSQADAGGWRAMQRDAHQRRIRCPSRYRNRVHPDQVEYARIVRAT
jgi:hypothetical protein